jgi:hypothetical protein
MMHSAPLSTIRRRQRELSGLGVNTGAVNSTVNYAGSAANTLGQGAGIQQLVLSAPAIAGAAISGAAAMGSAWATAAIPVIGPIIAGVTLGLTALFNRKGPKQKVATTQIVEAVIPKLQENMAAYFALPQHYASAQAQALANFDAGWQYIMDHCNIPEMGDPGQRCWQERQRGGKYDMFKDLRDPIANDPAVVPDPVVSKEVADALTLGDSAGAVNIGGLSVSPLLLAGGLLVLALTLGGGSNR